jgi:hypothetical protein
MEIFSIDVTEPEISFLRHSLELVTITGKDAKFLANLQTKLEQELLQIQEMKRQFEEQKRQELEAVIELESSKGKNKKT